MSLGLIIYSTGYSLFNVPYADDAVGDDRQLPRHALGYRMVFVSIGRVLSGAGTWR